MNTSAKQLQPNPRTEDMAPKYEFKVVVKADPRANLQIGGLQLIEFLNAPVTLSESGNVLYFATTDKGETAFLDQQPVAYVGQQIDGVKLRNISRAVMNKHGDYAFYAAFGGGAGIVFNGHFRLKTGDTLSNGCVISGFSDYVLLTPEGLYSGVATCSGHGPLNTSFVNGEPVQQPTPQVPAWIPRMAAGPYAYNNRHQYVSVTIGSSVETLEHKSLLFSSKLDAAQSVAMNERGQVLTADPMVFNYTDATEQPHNLSDTEYYARLIDLGSLKKFGMEPYRYEHGRAIYSLRAPLGYPFLSINDSGQIAFLVHYVKEQDTSAGGTALVVGTPNTPIMKTILDCSQELEITLNDIVIRPNPKLRSEVVRDPTYKREFLYLYTNATGLFANTEGILINAWHAISPKPGRDTTEQPVLGYIQNLVGWRGSATYGAGVREKSGQYEAEILGDAANDRSKISERPLLDATDLTKMFSPINPLAPYLDSPTIHIPVRDQRGEPLSKLHYMKSFTNYIGCYFQSDGPRPKFRTLATINWSVNYSGRVVLQPGEQPQFIQDMPSAVTNRPPQTSSGLPSIAGPVANCLTTYRDFNGAVLVPHCAQGK